MSAIAPDPISDEEASLIFGEYPTASPQRQAQIGDTLRLYDSQRDERMQREREAYFERVYTDLDTMGGTWKDDGETWKPDEKAAVANRQFLAWRLGKTPEDIRYSYPILRDEYASKNFALAEVSDDQFFQLVSEATKKQQSRRAAAEDIPASIVAARFANPDITTPEIIYDWRKKHADVLADMPPEVELEMLRRSNEAFKEIDGWMQSAAPAARQAFEALSRSVTSAGGTGDFNLDEQDAKERVEGMQKLTETLASLSRDDREKVYGMVALAAKAKNSSDDPSKKAFGDKMAAVFGNVGKSIERTIWDSVSGLTAVERDREIENDPKLRELANVGNEIQNIVDGNIDPIQYVTSGKGWWSRKFEEGAYGAAASVPYLATTAIPVAGPAITLAAYAGQEYNRVRFEYPDMPFGQARAMALVSGGAQAALDRFEVGLLKGALGETGKVLQGLARADAPYLTRVLSRSAAFTAQEYGQETLQNLSPVVVEEVGRALGADMPNRDWGKFPEWFKNTSVDTVFALLPFMALGVGGISIRELKRGEDFSRDARQLGEVFDKETANAIAAEEDPDKRQEMIGKAWGGLSDEGKTAFVQRVNEAVNAAHDAQQGSVRLDVAANEDGTKKFTVRNANGDVIYETTSEEAAAEAYDQTEQKSTLDQLLATSERDEQGQDDDSVQVGAQSELLFGEDGNTDALNAGSGENLGLRGEGTPVSGNPERWQQEANSARKGFDALGVRAIPKNGTASPKIDWDDRGRITLVVHRGHFALAEAKAAERGIEAGVFSRTILGEELIHAAHIVSLRNEWEAAGRPVGFKDFAKDDTRAIFSDIRTAVEASSPKERENLLSAIRASYHAYHSALSEDARDKVNSSTLLDEIEKNADPIKFVGELLRQAAQLRRDGSLSEEVHANLIERLAAWVRDAITKLKEVLPTIADGAFGKRAQDRLAKIEAELARAEKGGASQSDDGQSEGSGGSSLSGRQLDPSIRITATLDSLDKNPELRKVAVERARLMLKRIAEQKPASSRLGGKNREAAIAEAKADHSLEIADIQSAENAALVGVDAPKDQQRIKFGFVSRRQAADVRLQKRLSEITGDATRIDEIRHSMNQLKAIVSILPLEVRARVGGWQKLTEIKTDRGRASFLSDRIEMVGRELEKWLRGYYSAKLEKLFDRAKPAKDEAGKKKVGKAGADIHRLFDTLREAVDWTPEEADAHIAGLDALIAKGELTPEQKAHAQMESALVGQLADWQNADAERRAAAVKNATEVWEKAYGDLKIRKLEQKDERDKKRATLISDTGKSGTAAERDAKALADNGLKGAWKDNLLGLLNFEQVAKWVFGDASKEAERLADMERKASNTKEDGIHEKMTRLDELFEKLAGSRLAGEKLWWKLSQKSLDVEGRKLSELEGVTALLMWRQEDGRRHMIGKLDDTGKPVGPWNYDQSFVDKIESQLSDSARSVMGFLSKEYSGEWETLNPIYRELNGINLPRHESYAPLTVKPVQAQGGQTIDPITGTTMTSASTTPGSLRTRGNATAEPDFKDALQVFIAHTKQMEHWKAYAHFSNEARALLNNREVGNAVESKSGHQSVTVLRNWLDYFAQGGTRDAAASLAMTDWINQVAGNAASMALVGRIGTLAIQSTQLGAAVAEMPVTSYLGRLGRLLAGQLGWKAAFESPYIQRRLNEMPPAVRTAMEGLRASKPNVLRHNVQKLARLISGADALFTAGTYAIVYDYQLKQLGDEAAARQAAERIVDRVAQPTRAGARSIFENATTNPLARVGWAFASEARKNVALSAYAIAKNGWRSPEAARALLYFFVLNGFVGGIIRNAWRDLRDDDDEELFDEKTWNPKRMMLSAATEPFYGIPVFGDMLQSGAFAAFGEYLPSDSLFSTRGAAGALRHIDDIAAGERDIEGSLRDLDMIVTGAGLFNRDIAAAASLVHLSRDLFGVAKNAAKSDE